MDISHHVDDTSRLSDADRAAYSNTFETWQEHLPHFHATPTSCPCPKPSNHCAQNQSSANFSMRKSKHADDFSTAGSEQYRP